MCEGAHKRAHKFLCAHGPFIFIVTVTIFLYASTLMSGYFADDIDFLTRAQQGTLWRSAFLTIDGTSMGSSWRPLTGIFFAVTFQLPAALNHAVSLVLYLVLIFFVYRIAQVYFLNGAIFIATAAFAWLPSHVEPVVWVAARADLLAAVFATGAWLAFMREKRVAALALFIVSLLSKEVWILLPFVWLVSDMQNKSMRVNARWWCALIGTILTWFAVRFLMTGYTFGGYSIVAQSVFERVRAAAEQLVGFSVGVWFVGPIQLYAVSFAREWWFIGLFIIAVALIMALWHTRRTIDTTLLLAFIMTILPTLALVVTFPPGISSIGEQRYWLAPSVAVILLLGKIVGAYWHKRIVRGASYFFIFSCLVGTMVNITLFARAAHYRDAVIASWRAVPQEIAQTAVVAALPDTFHGVHLFAERYFLQTLFFNKLQQPARVVPLFQACGRRCSAELVRVTREPVQFIFQTNTSRLFFFGIPGMHKRVGIKKNGLNMLFWDGIAWRIIMGNTVEKAIPPRY